MTKRVHSIRPIASVAALCLVLLQLVNALHFTLVPHGFGARLSGFVHLHRALTAAHAPAQNSAATQPEPNRPTLVSDIAACAPETCPLGFAGPPCAAVPSSNPLCSLIWLPAVRQHGSRDRLASDRARALLSAPKTSPPATA